VNDRGVLHGAGPVNLGIRREQSGTRPAAVTDQELSLHQIVAQDLVTCQEVVERARLGRSSGKEPDPDRGIDEDHYAVRRLRPAFSRRRGTSRAAGSAPRNARRRSYAARRRRASSPRRTASVSVLAPLTSRASPSSLSSL